MGTSGFTINIVGDVSKNGGNAKFDDDVWLIAMGGDFAPYDRIDPDGTIGGFNAELINLVGLHAGADFRIVFDPYANCWTGADHTKAGPGIMRKDYDGCAGWFNTIERAEAVGFTQSWTQVGNEDFIIRAGWTLPSGISGTGKNMAGVKLGFVKGWWTDAGCLVRKGFSNVGTDTSGNANEAVYARAEYELVDDLINALKSGEVDMAFLGKEGSFHGDWTGLAWAGKTMGSCARGGQAIFTRMDSKLEPVWNSGFNKIYGNGQFAKLCEKYQSELPAGQFIGCV
jgi:ABC-type amino acid transport substrate-binding protein